MAVLLQCPQGHRLRVDESLAGRDVDCPICKSRVLVPRPESNPITDSGVVRILEADEALEDSQRRSRDRTCPRCGAVVPRKSDVCHNCKLMQYPTAHTWRHIFRQAVQELIERHRFRPRKSSRSP
jgi:hypothetical protein